SDGGITCRRPLIRPDEYILQQIDLVQFINAQERVGIERARHVDERQWRQIALDERDVRRQARHALVHVVERLEVRQLHHRKQRLLERVLNRGGGVEQVVEALLDQLRQFQRMESGLPDTDAHTAQPAGRARVGQEVLRQNPVKIEDRVPVKADSLRLV